MKKLLSIISLSIIFFIQSCNTNTTASGNPTQVLTAFFDAMQKKDMAKVKELSTTESQSMLNLMELGLKEAEKNGNKDMENFDKTKMEFGTAIIEGNNAKVPVKDKAKGDVVNFPMKKVDGKWKVAFDKTSIMQMASDKMKEGGVNMGDSLSKAMNTLKGVNMDSITKGLNEAMKDVKDLNIDSLTLEMKKAIDKTNK